MNELAIKIKDRFSGYFSSVPAVYFSPGRINLIGEHIDYNDGFVLPAAIDKGIYYAVATNQTDEIHFYAVDFEERFSVAANCLVDFSWFFTAFYSVQNPHF